MKKPVPEQIPFDLAHAATYTRDDFRVAECNENALAWIDKWPDWPAPLLVIHGKAGCGKTHLAHIWRAKAQAVPVTGMKQLQNPGNAPRAMVLDDVEYFIGDTEKERALFHLYNIMKETGGHLLFTAARPPQDWRFMLPDLKSRVMAAPAVGVGSPDDDLMAIVMSKIFSDRQIFVPQDVIAFLLPRMERSFAAVQMLADKIDKKALSEKRAVTIPLVKSLMEAE